MDAVEEIKNRLSIEDVVSQYVELKRAGRNFKGLSPFSSEKSPSFIVSPEKQIWHDFSSGKGGDMFTLVMELEGIDFKDALELLARQAGVDLAQFRNASSGKDGQQKKRLLLAVEAAARFYQLHLNKHRAALEYLRTKRQFSKETILQFRLGYAPNNEDALTVYLMKKGFTASEIKRAGLSTQRYRGMGDMFRGRIMVPLMDPQGQVIGFTARLLEDNPNAPKYINTPQTPLYDKSRHVFGLHLAKESIRKSNFAVIAEGNLDVIASQQAKVANVVATAGTALTEQQLKILGRLTPDVRLAFDQDRAGQNATERAIPIASKAGVNLSIINVPEGKDPDELIKKDPELWKRAINTPQYAVDWLISHYAAQLDLTTGPGKRRLSDQVLAVVKNLDDAVERDHYITKLADLLEVNPAALQSKLISTKTARTQTVKRNSKTQPVLDKELTDLLKAQNHMLCLTLLQPEVRDFLKPLTAAMFLEDHARLLFEHLKKHSDYEIKEGTLTLPGVAGEEVHNVQNYGKMLSLLYEELYRDLEITELRYEAARLQVRLVSTYVKTQKEKIATALDNADDKQTERLLQAARAFDQLLNSVKENDT